MTKLTDTELRELNIAACRKDFASYMLYVHTTDMSWVAGGRAQPVRHMFPLIEKYKKVAHIILRRAGDWESWRAESTRHTSVVAPPGSAKTTLSQYFMEWLLGQASLEWGKNWANDFHMAFVSSAEAQALRVSYAIKNTIAKNDMFKAVFPDVKPSTGDDKKWADGEWRVKGCTTKDPTFQAQGRRGDILGSRLNFIVYDDLVKQEEVEQASLTPLEIQKINNWITKTGQTRLVPSGCSWGNHTRWIENDPPGHMAKLIKDGGLGWEQILVQALVEVEDERGHSDSSGTILGGDSDGAAGGTDVQGAHVAVEQFESAGSEGAHVAAAGRDINPEQSQGTMSSLVSYWPERFTTAELLAIKEADPEGFALQYMGLPAPEEGIDFKIEMLSYDYDKLPWEGATDRANFAVVDSWDTAGTLNPRSDYTAGWTAAIDLRSWDIYLLNLYHERLEFPEVVDAIRGNVYSPYKPQFVWVEEKATGQSAIQQLLREGIRIEGVKAYGQRGSFSLQVVVNQTKISLAAGKVHFPHPKYAQMTPGMDWVVMAKTALLMYPRGQHDDIARAFIQLVFETFRLEQASGTYDPKAQSLAWGEPTGERLEV